MKINQKGFSVVEILVIIVVVGLLGAVGWLVYDRQKSKNNEQPVTQSSSPQQKIEETSKQEAKTADPNKGYLVVKEWGLRFKLPNNLADINYRIHGDMVAFYAKPTGYTVEYRSDYEKVRDGNYPQYAIGSLYRSTESSKDKIGIQVEGKKIGNYYYYTAHAFSSLATGAAPTGLYFDAICDKDTRTSPKCDEYMEAENKAFQLVNQGDTALLNTIEPTQ